VPHGMIGGGHIKALKLHISLSVSLQSGMKGIFALGLDSECFI
jgi:hypothetical protein